MIGKGHCGAQKCEEKRDLQRESEAVLHGQQVANRPQEELQLNGERPIAACSREGTPARLRSTLLGVRPNEAVPRVELENESAGSLTPDEGDLYFPPFSAPGALALSTMKTARGEDGGCRCHSSVVERHLGKVEVQGSSPCGSFGIAGCRFAIADC